MKSFHLAIILFVASFPASASPAQQSRIASLVARLSWHSVVGECNGVWRAFPRGEAAKELIRIGKPSTTELLKILTDENKGVAAHLILTAIWEPRNISWGNRFDGDVVNGGNFVQVYNGLKWVDVIDFKRLTINSKIEVFDLRRNSRRWHLKLKRWR